MRRGCTRGRQHLVTTDIARSRRLAGVFSPGHAHRAPHLLSHQEDRLRKGRELRATKGRPEEARTDAEQSYDPIVPVKVENRRAPARRRTANPVLFFPLLFRGGFLPVLVDPEPPDLRLQGLTCYSEFRSGPRRSGYAPMSFGKSCFDHFHFTIFQRRKPSV